MANVKHLTSALRLTLSLGTVDGKSVTKTVSVEDRRGGRRGEP